jgi:RNA polymerase sigma-70 factor (family 1)
MTTYSAYTDQDLTALLKEGDVAAFTEIYDRFQPLLYVYACKIVKDDDEAEDIVQDVFIYLWDKREDIHFTASLKAYLYSAVKYKFMNLLDHKKVRADYSASMQRFMDVGDYITDNYIREKEFIAVIESEVALLPEKMREVFLMSRKQNLSNKQIADRLNITEKTARNQVNTALHKLRVRLGLFKFLMFLIFY